MTDSYSKLLKDQCTKYTDVGKIPIALKTYFEFIILLLSHIYLQSRTRSMKSNMAIQYGQFTFHSADAFIY